jgi:hypothetical protein
MVATRRSGFDYLLERVLKNPLIGEVGNLGLDSLLLEQLQQTPTCAPTQKIGAPKFHPPAPTPTSGERSPLYVSLGSFLLVRTDGSRNHCQLVCYRCAAPRHLAPCCSSSGDPPPLRQGSRTRQTMRDCSNCQEAARFAPC